MGMQDPTSCSPHATAQGFPQERFTPESFLLPQKSCRGAEQVLTRWKSVRMEAQPVYPRLHPQPPSGFLLLHPWEPDQLPVQMRGSK